MMKIGYHLKIMEFRILGHGIPRFSKVETAFLKKKNFPDGNFNFRILHHFLPLFR
jgi:hypothetical protein